MAPYRAQFPGRPGLRVVQLLLLLLLAACSGGSSTPTPSPTVPVAAVSPTSGTVPQPGNPTPTHPSSPVVALTPRASAAVTPGVGGAVTIFAASSLTDAFTEMGEGFSRANPNVKVTFNFNASSNLKAQLEQGAKSDIYAPADIPQMEGAKGKGLIAGDAQIFANNKLALIVPAGNPGKITTPQDVAKPGVKLILAASYVPIGSYARFLFAKMAADPAYGADFYKQALANLVSEEETTRAVVNRIALGEGDAGVVYASDVTPAVAGKVIVIPIPESQQIIAQYPIARCATATNLPAADAFIAYALSDEGQAILRKWGFLPVPAKAEGGQIRWQSPRVGALPASEEQR